MSSPPIAISREALERAVRAAVGPLGPLGRLEPLGRLAHLEHLGRLGRREITPLVRACQRTTDEDDVGEPIVSALAFEDEGLWMGVTAFGLGLGEGVAVSTFREIAHSLGIAPTAPIHEVTLEARSQALTPSPAREIDTVSVDVALAQLLATTFAVFDVVRVTKE